MPSVVDFGGLSSPVFTMQDTGPVSPLNAPVTVFYATLIQTDSGLSNGDAFSTVNIPFLFQKDANTQDGSFDRGQPSSLFSMAQPAAGGSVTGGVSFPTTQANTFVTDYDVNPEWYKMDALDTVTTVPAAPWEAHYTTAPSPNTNHPVTNISVTKLTPVLPETDGRS